MASVPSSLRAWALAAVAAAGFAAPSVSHAQLTTVRVASGLSSPVFVTAPEGDARLFVVQRAGTIVILNPDTGAVLPTPFLDITAQVSTVGEKGLLGLAFPSNYASTGFFYVYYVNTAGNSVIQRYRRSANPDVADPNGTTVITIPQPNMPGFDNHKGGTVAFGPDGMLYLGLGDGGSGNDPLNNAQNDSVLLGKIIRIDVSGSFTSTYTIPPDNPFVGPPRDPNGTIRDEIWAKGVRNPFRFAFDRQSGDLWIGDVGQSDREEVDFEPAGFAGGRNYGWRIMEGSLCHINDPPPAPPCNSPVFTLPVTEYDHSLGCSITGGTVYHGLLPFDGLYFFGDFCSARIWTFDKRTGTRVERTAELAPSGSAINSIVAFGEDGFGQMYIVDMGGEIFRVTVRGVGCGLGGPELALALPLFLGLRRARLGGGRAARV